MAQTGRSIARWPGKIPAGAVSNGIATHQDWLPTLLAAAGAPDIKERLLKGAKVGDKKFHVHIDGYNLLPLLTGQEKESPRHLFVYPTDGGEICGIRYDDWKLVYMEQRAKNFDIWRDPFVTTPDETKPDGRAVRRSVTTATWIDRRGAALDIRLQDETGGFQAYVPLSFHPDNSEMSAVPAPTALDELVAGGTIGVVHHGDLGWLQPDYFMELGHQPEGRRHRCQIRPVCW